MRKILSAVLTLLAVLILPAAAFAQDTVYQETNISQAASISGAGFVQGAIPNYCTAALDTNENAVALTNSGSASSTALNYVSLQSWSSDTIDSFVVEAKVKFDELEGSKLIDFRFGESAGTIDYVIDLRKGVFYVNRAASEFTPEANVWYTIDIYVNKAEEANVQVYVDGLLAGSYNSANIDQFARSGVQLRFEAMGKSSAMSVGDVSIFKPGSVKMVFENNQLETVASSVEVSFDRAIKPNITKEHIKVCDADGGEVGITDFEPKYNNNGDCIGFTLKLAESLSKRKVYRVELADVEAETGTLKLSGVFGQGVEQTSDTFTVKPDENDFAVGSVELYKGIAGGKTRVQNLSAGFQSFDITIANDGTKRGEAVIVLELYSSNDEMVYSGGIKKSIGGFSDVTVNFGVYLAEAPSYARIRVVDNYIDKNDLAEELAGGDIF